MINSKSTLTHIIFKLLRVILDFSSQAMQARRGWSEMFRKEEHYRRKSEGKIKSFVFLFLIDIVDNCSK